MMATLFNKLSVRQIPEAIFRALEQLATRHDRSTEAEARQAIRAWVEPELVQESRNQRRRQVAERLNRMLAQVNSARRGGGLTPSHIAEVIGEPRAEDVEDWFLGSKEPSFAQLTAIAAQLGVDATWLKHGDRTPYPPAYEHLEEDPVKAVDWLLSWTPKTPDANGNELRFLHLVRALDNVGSLYIVKQSQRDHYLTYNTNIHVSEAIGAGGEGALAALFVALELLDKRRLGTSGKLLVFGHLLPADDVAQLTSGHTNPDTLLTDRHRSTWWEDIWDPEMAPKREYWPGWHTLCRRIEGVIDYRTRLKEIRARIRRGELPGPRTEADDIEPTTATASAS